MGYVQGNVFKILCFWIRQAMSETSSRTWTCTCIWTSNVITLLFSILVPSCIYVCIYSFIFTLLKIVLLEGTPCIYIQVHTLYLYSGIYTVPLYLKK